ncbi:hypothetical protein RJ639_034426 [Escallonia herrerae]|uniref:BAR domain-containing protein n=1 Tax=Escallonia herrerae TaxID=1293975 RepID=A0AA88W012_9ASTE|nr:hypothetical protein RJ639_003817 [Escallonia herrerae]KAK3033376.1 hypothetical protein RJ639_034426 [Escallonia herrerae]
MKTSLKKLRGFGLNHHKHEKKEHRLQPSLAKLDELSQANQDMQDMRDCYDSLLSAAAATANSAYEFSESLREMGDCLLEKTALNDDEENGKVLLMLGKVQFEVQKLIDSYRSHISQTITVPSESLLNELRIVEVRRIYDIFSIREGLLSNLQFLDVLEMKRQCDEKRSVYEYMQTRHKEKGRLRSSKGEYFSSHQLQAAREEYDEEASFFVFRMKSLKRGQSRSLLTQAARHHAAQLNLFRKALSSLEAIEPHVKLVTQQQHIDYGFSGLVDDQTSGDNGDVDDDESDSDDNDSSEARDDGEYGQNDRGQDGATSRNSMELDNVDLPLPQVAAKDAAKENIDTNPGGISFPFRGDGNAGSKSAPLLAEKNYDTAERFKPMRQSSTRKCHTYVLPTPVEGRNLVSSGLDAQVPQRRTTNNGGGTPNLWHSSPLEHKKNGKILGHERLSGPIILNAQSVLKESNSNARPVRLPSPLAEGLSSSQLDHCATSDTKKTKRQFFSGPLTSNSWSNKPISSASGPIPSTGKPQLFSGPILHTPLPRPASTPKLFSSASPTFISSPKISELHALPRPPSNLAPKIHGNLIRHSGPLPSRGQELLSTKQSLVSKVSSTLPVPPQTIPRSYSIPHRSQREPSDVSKPFEAPHSLKMAEDIASPPLTPIILSNF